MSSAADLTAKLKASRTDPQIREEVYRLVYEDLRRLAGSRVASGWAGDTLSVTALVNEAYLKLTDRTGPAWADRGHFLRVASRAMRQITVDTVRARLSAKRGGGRQRTALDDLPLASEEKSEMVLALEDGLAQLAGEEPRLIQVVECRFFAGLTISETAEALEISPKTVERDWDRARAWLKRFMT